MLPWPVLLLACMSVPDAQETAAAAEYAWSLPGNLPVPRVPEDNPMSAEKVELGRRLFYDPRLSHGETMSCATCHQQARAFTDGRAQGVGETGEVHPRGPMGLTNVAYASRLAWASPLLGSLEAQAMLPLFGEAPVELGMAGREALLLERLAADDDYLTRFAQAWPDDTQPLSVAHVVDAIACFERTLISGDSPYDRYLAGDASALGPAEVRGMALFFSERLECFHCHGGFNFSDTVDHSGMPLAEVGFHNTGLYNLDGAGAYPADNTGIMEITGHAQDMGRFKAPTLRNIAATAPYMHDGSLATLEEVVAHYEQGGRAGDSPLKSEFVAGFILSEQERAELIAFLHSLTDETFLTNPAFSDPF